MPRILIRPLADQELDALAQYIARASPGNARRLYDAAEQAFALLARMPEMGSPWPTENPRLSGLRYWSIQGFPNHVIFYRPLADGIEVVRVLGGGQNMESLLNAT